MIPRDALEWTFVAALGAFLAVAVSLGIWLLVDLLRDLLGGKS